MAHISRARDTLLIHRKLTFWFVWVRSVRAIRVTNHMVACFLIQVREQRYPFSVSLVLDVQCTLNCNRVGKFFHCTDVVYQFHFKFLHLFGGESKSHINFFKLSHCVMSQTVPSCQFSIDFVHKICELLIRFTRKIVFCCLK